MSDSSTMGDSSPTEAGPTDTGATDGRTDAPSDAGSDASFVDCGKIPPTGTQIVASTAPLILQGGGLTSDGYAFYEDANSQILYVVDSTGGSPVSLGTMTSQGGTFYRNGGKAALFAPTPGDPNTLIGALSAWSKASGPTVISTSIFAWDAYVNNYDVTKDGAYVIYFDLSGNTATLTISTIDGLTQHALIPNIDLSSQYCWPMAQFVGNTIVTYYCLATPVPDSGVAAGALTIASLAVNPNFAAMTPVTIANLPAPTGFISPDAVSPDGTNLLISTASGLELYPIAGGAPTLIDANGGGGFFTGAGNVVYGTSAGGLKRYSGADAGAPLVLDSTGVTYPMALSPDGNWVEFGQNVDSTGTFVDIWLASATTPGSLTQVRMQTDVPFGSGFSADSKYVTFVLNYPMTFGINTYDLYAAPVSGGTAKKVVTTGGGGFTFTGGSKLVVNTNADKTTGSADIQSVDLSSTGAATTLVTQADPNYFYAGGPNKVFYTWYCAPNSTAGVWAVTAP